MSMYPKENRMKNTDFASANLTVSELNAIVKKLGGEEDALRFLRDELVVGPPNFPVWKRIWLGTGLHTADNFHRALEHNGKLINDWGSDLLREKAFTALAEMTEVDLVVVSLVELGLMDGVSRGELYEKALRLGLQPCPAEVGPQLRLQYQGQPNGEELIIGMEPIVDSDGYPRVFSVACNSSDQWLNGDYDGGCSTLWGDDNRIVFVKPRK